MIYYEKTTKEYKLSQEKIKLFRIENQKEINELNKLKNLLSTQVTENIDNNNNSSDIDREDNNENKNLELTSDIYTELNIDSVNQKDLFQNYPVFEKFSPDIKKMTSYFTEITMNLVFKVLNVNIDQLDQKNNKLNTTVNGRIINQKKCFNNISQNDIDKFLVNIKKSSSDKIIIKNINEDKINDILLLNDNVTLISVSDDKTMRIWSLENKECVNAINTGDIQICLGKLKNGKFMLGGEDGSITIFNIVGFEPINSIKAHDEPIEILYESPFTGDIISGSQDNLVKIFKVDNCACIKILEGHKSTVLFVSQIDENTILTSSVDKTVKIWNI